MRKKLSLEVDGLAVDSFATGGADQKERGTVEANAACTCLATCACPSARYWCADSPETSFSCDYTQNASCWTTS
ncbi:MAG TPA: hypothetical protein VFJ16_19940 [Longimicrobium sp.]|nr:hypothetical protein [Longimicrobium sp.]